MNDNENVYLQTNIYIENRETIRITGVKDVDTFSEESVSVQTHRGDLLVGGEALKISKLDVESGELSVEGKLTSLIYTEAPAQSGGSIFSKFFK